MIYCRDCGRQMHESAVACPGCGAAQAPAASNSDDVLRFIVPVGRSGWAVAAGYLGLLSICLVPAPAAVVCGMLGLRDIRRNPKKLGKPRAILGIVLGAVGSILLLMALLASHRR